MKTKILLSVLAVSFSSLILAQGMKKNDANEILHSRKGLGVFFKKLANGDSVTIAYLGGSITAATGYRIQTEQLFKNENPQAKIRTIKAAVGGTGSPLGVFRVDNEVLKYNPDLVFIEFAVNDGSTDSLTICRSMEGIIRKIKTHNPKTGICLLYTINEPMLKKASAGKLSKSAVYMEILANYYGIPSINLGTDVYKLLSQNKLIFKDLKGSSSNGKIIFTNDGTHPTTEGHQIYTRTIDSCFRLISKINDLTNYKIPRALYPHNYQSAARYAPQLFLKPGNWKNVSSQKSLQQFTADLPNLVSTDNPEDSLTISFFGSFFGIEDIIGPTSSAVSIQIDGQKPITKVRFDNSCTFYRRHYFYLDSLTEAKHTVVVRLDTVKIDKAKILKAPLSSQYTKYQPNLLYIGNVLLLSPPVE